MRVNGLEGRYSTIELRPQRPDQQFRGYNDIGTQKLPPTTVRVKGRLGRKGAPHKGQERSVAILRGRPVEEIPRRWPE